MNSDKERILLVEDERALRIALQDALEAEGYGLINSPGFFPSLPHWSQSRHR